VKSAYFEEVDECISHTPCNCSHKCILAPCPGLCREMGRGQLSCWKGRGVATGYRYGGNSRRRLTGILHCYLNFSFCQTWAKMLMSVKSMAGQEGCTYIHLKSADLSFSRTSFCLPLVSPRPWGY
jgi:hypothetical protein